MTLTVTPEQMTAIANLLTASKTAPASAPGISANAPFSQPTAAPVQQQSPAPTPMPSASGFPTPTVPYPNTVPNTPMQQVPIQQTPPMMQQAVPTQVQNYTVQDLALACRPLMEAGRQAELQALLAEFGATTGINSIPEDKRSAFASRLRAMGGQI